MFPPTGAFFAAVSHSALIPVKMWSTTVHPVAESSTFISECESFDDSYPLDYDRISGRFVNQEIQAKQHTNKYFYQLHVVVMSFSPLLRCESGRLLTL